jgi:hypothetical protein
MGPELVHHGWLTILGVLFCAPEYAEDCHYPLAGGPVLAQPAWDDSGAFTLAEITFDIDVQIDGSYGYNFLGQFLTIKDPSHLLDLF